MADEAISLYFRLKPGEKADLEVVAAAAIAWVEGLRAAARVLDPEAEVRVELVDAEEGSLVLNAFLKWFETEVEGRLEQVERGGRRLPRTKKLVLALAIFVITTGVPTYDFYFGEDDYTEEDRAIARQTLEQTAKDPEVEAARKKFYRSLERDPTITGVGVKEEPKGEPLAMVPSNLFAEAGGLFEPEEFAVEPRTTYPEMDVVLVRPTLSHHPRVWTFKVEGLPEFDAVMKDSAVLVAIERGGWLDAREGIPMRIRLQVKEVLVDGQWRAVRGGRAVVKVISPEPPSPSPPPPPTGR